MKLIPGPLLIPSLVLGGSAVAIQAAAQVAPSTDWPAIIMATGALITAGTVGFVLVWKAIKGVQAEVKANTVITTQTRDMADGRLTDLQTRLATSEGNAAKLVAEQVAQATESVLSKAEGVLETARVAAVEVVARAERAAAALEAGAERKGRGR